MFTTYIKYQKDSPNKTQCFYKNMDYLINNIFMELFEPVNSGESTEEVFANWIKNKN
jgi:hypothetical protein